MKTLARIVALALLALSLAPRHGAAQPAPPQPAPPPAPPPQPPPPPPDGQPQPPPPDGQTQPPPPDGQTQPPPPQPPQPPPPTPPTPPTPPPPAKPAPAAADPGVPLTSKIKATVYGFVEINMVYDSTESCQDFCSNFQIAKSGTYRGNHGRTIFSARDSRFGLKLAAPETNGIKVSGQLETDFFGPTATSEQGTWVNAVLRFRHAFLKFETPVVDVLIGQTWNLFGWQANYLVASVQEPGLPGQMFQRTPQVRFTKAIKLGDAATLELALAAMRPPQMDSATPEEVGGARLILGKWTGLHTLYMTSTAIQPASIGISQDLRRFRLSEFSTTPRGSHTLRGGGVAFDAYLPIVKATKEHKDNALALTGELVMGHGISDMYTALGGAGTTNPGIPAADPAAPPGTYTPNFDAGLAAYDASGRAHLIQWTSYMAGAEFYPGPTDGRVGIFANYGRMQSDNTKYFGGGAVNDPVAGKTRESEDFYDAGVFADPTKVTRIGLDGAIYADHYVDGTTAKNYSIMTTAWLFF